MSDKLQQQDFFGTESNTLMSLRVDSPAKTLAKQGHKTESQAHNLVFGQNCTELLAKLDQATQSWRMLQHSFLEIEGDGLAQFSETWPQSGMMQDGNVYQLQALEHPTLETESSLLPTPTARDWKGARKPETLAAKGRNHTNSLPDAIRSSLPGKMSVGFVEWMMGYPIGYTHLNPQELPKRTKKQRQD